jgi:hypothetical protein
MVLDILRFNKNKNFYLENTKAKNLSLGQLLKIEKYINKERI